MFHGVGGVLACVAYGCNLYADGDVFAGHHRVDNQDFLSVKNEQGRHSVPQNLTENLTEKIVWDFENRFYVGF